MDFLLFLEQTTQGWECRHSSGLLPRAGSALVPVVYYPELRVPWFQWVYYPEFGSRDSSGLLPRAGNAVIPVVYYPELGMP